MIDLVYCKKTRKPFWLQNICNKFGDFRLAYTYKNKLNEHIWYKAKKEMTVMYWWEKDISMLEKINHRQILPYEIIIDLDEPKSIKNVWRICDYLEDKKENYFCFFTGSRGYHIHIVDLNLLNLNNNTKREMALNIYSKFKIDIDFMKANRTTLISMEYAPHWKTGKVKTIQRCNCWAN